MKNTFVFFLFLFILSCNDEPKPDNTGGSVSVSKTIEKSKKNTDYYTEKYRPQVHFSPEKMWMNDPNGLVFYQGEYHMFYQYYPDSTVWGPMHWGHAVSKDLSHWEHLPIALYPDELGYIFSGSVVMDLKNTAGFAKEKKPAMVAIFTHHDPVKEKEGSDKFQYQSLAYSLDRGRTWTKYEGNPVLENPGISDFRDPKVFWDDERSQWVMILAAKDHVEMYASLDLKTWKKLSDWGSTIGSHVGIWECPDLIKMKIQGTNDEYKWLLTVSVNAGSPQGGSGTQYFIGDFDGKTFTPDEKFAGKEAHWIDYGRDNYAGVTWSNVPYGNQFMIAWMSNWDYAQDVPTEKWRSAMTLPRQWSLVKTNQGVLLRTFVDELLGKLRIEGLNFNEPQTINGTLPVKSENKDFDPSVSEYRFLFKKPEGASKAIFGLRLYNDNGEEFKVGFDAKRNQFFTDRTKLAKQDFNDKFISQRHYAPTVTDADILDMYIVIDKSSCEFFAEGGFMVMTDIFFPEEDFNHVDLFSEQAEVELLKASISGLKSIWR